MAMTGHDHPHDHDHDHDHDHAHGHAHAPAQPAHGHAHAHGHHHHHGHGKAFGVGLLLNVAYVAVEAGVGIAAGSLALIADAAHNAVDALSLLMAWVAATLARRAPTVRRTYGMRRSTILAALANGVLLLIAVGGIGWEAVHRLRDPAAVDHGLVLWVAVVGIVINLGTAAMFWRGREKDLNIRAAFLHMLGDAAVTVGVLIGAFAMRATGWAWIDPALSLAIVVVIAATSIGLTRQAVDLALDAVPAGIDPEAVRAHLAAQPGIVGVHDLHIWGMSTTEVALTAHLVAAPGGFPDAERARVGGELQARFGIAHSTIQVESGDPGIHCRQAEEGAV